VDHGFDNLETLRVMATWTPVQLQETLKRLLMGSAEQLGGRKGLSALEVLEIAIRALGNGKKG